MTIYLWKKGFVESISTRYVPLNMGMPPACKVCMPYIFDGYTINWNNLQIHPGGTTTDHTTTITFVSIHNGSTIIPSEGHLLYLTVLQKQISPIYVWNVIFRYWISKWFSYNDSVNKSIILNQLMLTIICTNHSLNTIIWSVLKIYNFVLHIICLFVWYLLLFHTPVFIFIGVKIPYLHMYIRNQ